MLVQVRELYDAVMEVATLEKLVMMEMQSTATAAPPPAPLSQATSARDLAQAHEPKPEGTESSTQAKRAMTGTL